VNEDFRRGRFDRLRGWLVENIHRHGQRFRAGELCRRATGRPLSAAPFLSHLNEKYGPLYGVC
jgi:carboxypeptidase Taq